MLFSKSSTEIITTVVESPCLISDNGPSIIAWLFDTGRYTSWEDFNRNRKHYEIKFVHRNMFKE